MELILSPQLERSADVADEIQETMTLVREGARAHAKRLGLMRDTVVLKRLLRIAMLCDLVVIVLVPLSESGFAAFLGVSTAVVLYAALHMDPRTRAGALVAGDLHRLRDALRKAASTSTRLDSMAIRSLLPAGVPIGEIEPWVVSVGCKTKRSEEIASRIWYIGQEDPSRPRRMSVGLLFYPGIAQGGFLELVVLASARLVSWATAPFRATWRLGLRLLSRSHRVGGLDPVLW